MLDDINRQAFFIRYVLGVHKVTEGILEIVGVN